MQKQELFQSIFKPFAKLLSDKVSAKKSTNVISVLASIYTSDDSNTKFRYSGLHGMLSLEIDRQRKTNFLRMYHLDNLDIIFECELYYGFDENYRKVRPKLYVFDILDGVVAFDFRSPEDAQSMYFKIKSCSKKSDEIKKILEERKEEEAKKKESGTLKGFFKGIFSKAKQPEKHEQTVIIDVQKKNSISFDPKNGVFDTNNIPPEWSQIFMKLGYGKKQLEDKTLAADLMKDIVVYQTVKEAEVNPHLKKELEMKARISYKEIDDTVQSVNDSQLTKDTTKEDQRVTVKQPEPPQETKNASGHLFEQICAGNFKLRPVTQQGNAVHVDASKMNKDEREDMANYLKNQIKKRNQALHRFSRVAEDDDDTAYV